MTLWNGFKCIANNNKKKGLGVPTNNLKSMKRMVASPKKKKKSGVGKKASTVVLDGLAMSRCAAKYAIAVSNPWHSQALGSCVPSKPARPSQKVTGFSRFDVSAPAGGWGYVLFMPCVANNKSFALYTNGTGASPSFLDPTISSVVTGIAMSNMPYSRTDLVDTGAAGSIPLVQGRLISFGFTAQYIGTELNRGGLTYCFTDPAHENLAGLTIGALASRYETELSTPASSRGKCTGQISAISAQELEYPGAEYSTAATTVDANILAWYPFSLGNPVSSTETSVGAAPMVFYFTNPSSAVMTYHIEAIAHAEFVGSLTEGKTSENSVDTAGLERVMSAVDRAQARKQTSRKSFPALLKDCLGEVARELAPVALSAGKAMLTAALI